MAPELYYKRQLDNEANSENLFYIKWKNLKGGTR